MYRHNPTSLARYDLPNHPECIHMPLVLLKAKEYFTFFRAHQYLLTLQDFINAGYMVLARCYKLFDPSKNITFATFLCASLKREFRQLTFAQRLIYTPKTATWAARKAITPRSAKTGRKHISEKSRAMAIQAMHNNVEGLQHTKKDSNLIDIYNSGAIDRVINSIDLQEALPKLSERYRKVIDFYHGLNGHKQMNYQEIGESGLLGKKTTRQNIEILYRQAICKLRKLMDVERVAIRNIGDKNDGVCNDSVGNN